MAEIEYKAKLLPDGHLSCPKTVVDRLKLQAGIQVRVIIDNLEEIPRKAVSLYGKFPQLRVITEGDIEEVKKEWDKGVERMTSGF